MFLNQVVISPVLVCVVFAVLATATTPQCLDYDPFAINATQNASELRCPNCCDCKYCPRYEDNILEYSHDVYCSSLHLQSMPSKDTVPTNARYYNLQNNLITDLKSNSFSTSTDLEYLRLNKNSFKSTTIARDAFIGLKKLKYFTLDGNKQLSKLIGHWFIDLVSLEYLYANDCGISIIERGVFKNCKRLKTIHLSSNTIAHFPTNVFQNIPLLNYIYLDNNRLSNIPNHAFLSSDNLRKIVLNDNSLSTISEDVGIQNLTTLRILNVGYNKFSCDCSLVWFRRWINTTNVTLQDIGYAECKSTSQHGIEVHHKLLDFDPDKLQCSKLIRDLMIAIPSVVAVVFVALIGILLYNFRYDIRYWKQRRRLRKQYQQLDNQGPAPINGEDIRYDAFVSYNSKDQDWILKVLQPSLEAKRHFKLCVDYRDFIPGEAIVNNIANAVKYSRKVLLIVSKNFAKSEWCYFELEMARMRMFDNHEDILVVVLLEKVSSKDMPILLHKILTKKTYIEWEEHPERQALFWAKLEAALLSPNCHRDRLLVPPN